MYECGFRDEKIYSLLNLLYLRFNKDEVALQEIKSLVGMTDDVSVYVDTIHTLLAELHEAVQILNNHEYLKFVKNMQDLAKEIDLSENEAVLHVLGRYIERQPELYSKAYTILEASFFRYIPDQQREQYSIPYYPIRKWYISIGIDKRAARILGERYYDPGMLISLSEEELKLMLMDIGGIGSLYAKGIVAVINAYKQSKGMS